VRCGDRVRFELMQEKYRKELDPQLFAYLGA
jgi:hypothetical protein